MEHPFATRGENAAIVRALKLTEAQAEERARLLREIDAMAPLLSLDELRAVHLHAVTTIGGRS